MLLTRLKYWRELRGYTVRKLAKKSGVGFTTISFLENLHRPPQGTTASKLAAALDVEVVDLYGPEPAPVSPAITNDNAKSLTLINPARPTRGRPKKVKLTGLWVGVEAGHVYLARDQDGADHLKAQFGRVRVYRVDSWKEAADLHTAFRIRVAGGRDAW